jgi:hypothetical protein
MNIVEYDSFHTSVYLIFILLSPCNNDQKENEIKNSLHEIEGEGERIADG